MKNKGLTWLVAVACLWTFLACGQSSRSSHRQSSGSGKNGPALSVPADLLNVDITLQKAPEYVVDGKKTRIGAGAPDLSRQWLVNEISFGFSMRTGRNSRLTILDAVKVELYLYVPGPARDRQSYRWFYGCQKLHCLVLDPEQHSRRYWASLFLPPQYVYLHVPQERGRYSLRAIEGVVLISDRENKLLGRRVFNYVKDNKGKVSSARAKSLIAAVDEIRRKGGADCIDLWPREMTPWAWLDSNRFELPLTLLPEDKAADHAQPQQSKADEQENNKE